MKIAPIPQRKEPSARQLEKPIIPLERPEVTPPETGDYEALRLYTDPTDTSSAFYTVNVKYFGEGTPEAYLKFQKDLTKAIVGQNLTMGPKKFAITQRLLKGDALAAFKNSARNITSESNATYDGVMIDLTKHVFPNRAIEKQRR